MRQINQFFNSEIIAVAGVSRNKKKFGNTIFRELRKKGFQVVPINPNAEMIDEVNCYPSVNDLPEGVNSLLIATAKDQTDQVLRQAINRGIKNIWVQQFSDTKETLSIAMEYNQDIIHKKCIFMFAEPVAGFHKFHRAIASFMGRLPE